MSFIKDFNKDFEEIKYEFVKWFRSMRFSDILHHQLERYDIIRIFQKEDNNIIIGLVLEVVGDRMLLFKNLDNFELNSIYPEEIEEINILWTKKLKNEIKKNEKTLKELILDYPSLIDNWIINKNK